jgi:hypothetical protein
VVTASTVTRFEKRLGRTRDHTNDRVLRAASERSGVLLVAPGISTPQLITRRPVLLDPGALDMLPYALAGAPAVERSLQVGYGVDFFDPPRVSLHYALMPKDFVRALWERRNSSQWYEVAVELGATDVLVPASWTLNGIPEVARNAVYALYQLAGEATGPSGSQ